MLRRTKLSILTLGTAALVLGAVATFNGIVDANNLLLDTRLFGGDPIGKYVSQMRVTPSGIRYSSEERQIKARLVEETAADCYVIGSSQIMLVNRTTLPSLQKRCSETINLGVSGSALEDSEMFAGLAGEKKTTRLLLFGIDPWSFKINQDRRWRTVEHAFWHGRSAIGLPNREDLNGDPDTPDFFRLFSYAYLERNWLALKKRAKDADKAANRSPDGDQPTSEYLRFMPDGTLLYPSSILHRDPDRALDDGSYRIKEPFVEPEAVDEWRATIRWLQGRGIAVELLVPPYHPTIWTCMNRTVCNGLEAAESAARRLAAELNLKVIGGYDPRPFSLKAKDYIDERHLQPASLQRLETQN
jgi:hypothetical protein